MECSNIIISNGNVTDINVIFDTDVFRLGTLTKVSACSVPAGSTVTFQSSDSTVAQIIPYTDCCCDKCLSKCYIKPVSLGFFDLVLWAGDVKKVLRNLEVLPAEDQDDGQGGGDVDPDEFRITPGSVSIKIGDQYTIKVFPESVGPEVVWKSSNQLIASVRSANESGGVVCANSKGTAVITASYNGKKKMCTVGVNEIGIAGNLFKIAIGQEFTVPFDIYPLDLPIYWTSSNPQVASINNHGIITGLYLGDTIITATVITATGPLTQAFTVRVVNNFDPIVDLKSEDIVKLKIYDTELDLYNDNTSTNIKVMPEGEFVPKLYYVRIDDHPYIFNYKICAVRDDVDKFLLRTTNREA